MQKTLPFGQQVRRHRHALGLTQDTLAEHVGCATQTIRKLEGGQRRPSYQMAARLAQMLELSTNERETFLEAIPTIDTDPASELAQDQHAVTPARNLPTYLTPFVGREQEQAELARLLATPDHRC